MKEKFEGLYNTMASSNNVNFMHIFGHVHKEMMNWMIANKPELALEWLDKLEAIKWKNYLTQKEAEKIVTAMVPKAPWSREQWKQAMDQHGYEVEREPFFNGSSLYAATNMIMSDSSETLKKYIGETEMLKAVYDLAVDKLTDKDGVFCIRDYFGL